MDGAKPGGPGIGLAQIAQAEALAPARPLAFARNQPSPRLAGKDGGETELELELELGLEIGLGRGPVLTPASGPCRLLWARAFTGLALGPRAGARPYRLDG